MKRTAEELDKDQDVSNDTVDDKEKDEPAKVAKPDDFWRCQIEAVYARRNPHKLSNVQALLEKYSGREAILYAKVCKTYDLDPSKFYTDPQAWEQYETDVKPDEPGQDPEPGAGSDAATGSGVSVPSLFGISSFDQPVKKSQTCSDSDSDHGNSSQQPQEAPKAADGECKTQ
eukprot:s15_g41.t1